MRRTTGRSVRSSCFLNEILKLLCKLLHAQTQGIYFLLLVHDNRVQFIKGSLKITDLYFKILDFFIHE